MLFKYIYSRFRYVSNAVEWDCGQPLQIDHSCLEQVTYAV